MKKLFKILIVMLSAFSFNLISPKAVTCSINDQYHNSGQFHNFGTKTSYNVSQELIYEITSLKMNENNKDVFEVYGWAFNSLKDTDLGGKRGDKTSDDATVDLVLYPIDEPNNASLQVKLDVIYAETTNGSCPTSGCNDRPKYFDYTFWNCYKKRLNNVNYCIDQPGDSSGNTHGWTSPTLTGGFKGSIDLKDAYENEKLKKDKEYRLKIAFYRGGKKEFEKDASVFTDLVTDSVKSYKGYDNDDGDDHLNIDITGFGEKATVIVSEGLPIGDSGLSCNSPYKNIKKVYYERGSAYFVTSDTIQSCRGKIGSDCTSNGRTGNGAINLYGLYGGKAYQSSDSHKVPKTGGKNGNISYAPASWLRFNGTITLKTKTKTEDDPDVCEGKERYYLYYYMEDGVAEDFKGNISHNALFKDAEVLRELNFSSNHEFSDVKGGVLSTKTVRKGFDKYYNNFWRAIESGTGYIKDGDKYYLVPSEFYKWTNSSLGVPYTFSDEKGSDTFTYVSFNQESFRRNPSTNGLGYSFLVKENIDYSDKNNKPVSVKSGAYALSMNKMYKHFSVYQLTVCRDEVKQSQCPDTVDSAQCVDSDSGTKFIFNENDDKTICTIPKGNNSGFVAIEEGETNGYCSMACKEDLEGYLPTSKDTAAGQYFKLDNYVPKIKANRTCVTSKIDYSKFDSQKKGMEKGLIDSYNLYQDWLAYHKGMVSRDNLTKSDGGGVMPCPDQNGDYIDNIVPHYSYKYWEVDAFSGPNGMKSWGFMTEKYAGTCGYTCNSSGRIDPVPCNGQTLAKYKESVKNDTIGAKDSFNGVQDDYSDLFNSYNRCFNWAEITNDTRTSGGGGGVEPAKEINGTTSNNISNYLYSFEPKVTFNYPDPDGSIFPVEYEYKYGTRDVDMVGFNRVNDFWPYMATPSNKYDDGGASLDPDSAQYFIKCTGQKCTEGMKVSIPIYRNGAVRRDEKVEYTYHLPDVFTSVPSGRVTTKPTGSGTFLQLDKEAVPVNINTFAGTYNYQIKIADLKDELRLSKEGNNPDDNFEKRFNGSEAPGALNEGEDYVCHYKVVNDIYLPGPQKFNFFYRVVDTYNINPLNRTLGYNWTTGKAETIKKIIQEDALDYQTLTNNPSREKFEFTLTPVTMQSIRRYNAQQTISDDGYADWDLKCADYGENVSGVKGYHCTSNFITCLAGGQGNRCSEIVGDSHDNGDYTEVELKHNRDLLINKQNELDGRG